MLNVSPHCQRYDFFLKRKLEYYIIIMSQWVTVHVMRLNILLRTFQEKSIITVLLCIGIYALMQTRWCKQEYFWSEKRLQHQEWTGMLKIRLEWIKNTIWAAAFQFPWAILDFFSYCFYNFCLPRTLPQQNAGIALGHYDGEQRERQWVQIGMTWAETRAERLSYYIYR